MGSDSWGKPVDKAWEAVQIKAFTHWVNSVLAPKQITIVDISSDFCSGVNFIAFLELLTEKTMKKRFDRKPRMRIQKIQNLHLALLFMETTLGISPGVVGIGAEDIVDGHTKLILGMLYTLYRQTRIATITAEGKSSEEALLAWLRSITESYDGVEIGPNFRESLRDGLVLAALLDAYDGGKTLPYANIAAIDDAQARIAATFGAAETAVGIPTLLDAGEVAAGTADERSLVLYSSLLFHAFAARAQTDKVVSKGKAAQSALEARVAELEKENAALTSKLSGKSANYEELASQNAALRTALDSLAAKLDTQTADLSAARAAAKEKGEAGALAAKREAVLTEKVAVLKALLEAETDQKASASVTADAATEAATAAEREVVRLRAQLAEAQESADADRKARDQARRQVRRTVERAAAERAAVDLLRQELERHISDLHRWRRYLLYDRESYLDFGELRAAVLAQVEEKEDSFDEQLAILRDAMRAENATIDRLLEGKREEYEKLTAAKGSKAAAGRGTTDDGDQAAGEATAEGGDRSLAASAKGVLPGGVASGARKSKRKSTKNKGRAGEVDRNEVQHRRQPRKLRACNLKAMRGVVHVQPRQQAGRAGSAGTAVLLGPPVARVQWQLLADRTGTLATRLAGHRRLGGATVNLGEHRPKGCINIGPVQRGRLDERKPVRPGKGGTGVRRHSTQRAKVGLVPDEHGDKAFGSIVPELTKPVGIN
eukprot:CAMPEP_0170738544 /NCGR_PEP_ID=MMETSP0437-20130122/4700_1 /TAXON_ID=0 /ORGANISM="Sexangularia sp." /LENGTH=719 /DNA_ID=CAMNT_0011076971 /DNA_START=63 /DNA_END=2224 /DNA_ORIENTATION=+